MTEQRALAQAQALAARLPPLLVAVERVAASLAGGAHGRRRAGSGDTFWQYRRAQPGDAASTIDWRRSARGQGLYVRETEWAAAQGLWLWADSSASMDWRSHASLPSKLERGRLLMLAMASLLLRGGERVALIDSAEGLSSGPGVLPRLAEDLLRRTDRGGLPRPRTLPPHAEILLISDFLLPLDGVETTLAALAAQGAHGHLLQVLDPAEETLPYRGRIRFTGLEDEDEILVRRVEDLRPQYQQRVRQHRDGLAAIARAHGWSFACHHTDQAPQAALLALYQRLSWPRRGAARS